VVQRPTRQVVQRTVVVSGHRLAHTDFRIEQKDLRRCPKVRDSSRTERHPG
jgi:hypothetical protein